MINKEVYGLSDIEKASIAYVEIHSKVMEQYGYKDASLDFPERIKLLKESIRAQEILVRAVRDSQL